MVTSAHIAILVSAAVALCPLQCLPACHHHGDPAHGCDVRLATVADHDTDADDHDHQHSVPADHHRPSHQHQHGDCVCQGALPVQHFVLHDDCAVDWTWALAAQAGETSQTVAMQLASPRISASFFWPELTSGHDLCALISCWRI